MAGRKSDLPSNVVPMTEGDGLTSDERAALEAERIKPFARFVDGEEQASDLWDVIAPELAKLGRLKAHFAITVAEYCRVVVKLQEIRDELIVAKEVYTNEGRNGKVMKSHPQVAQRNELWRQWRSLTAELGLSPAAEKGILMRQAGLFDGDENEFNEFKG